MGKHALIVFAVLVGTVPTASADIRYRIRPSYGEMKSFGRPPKPGDCDNKIQLQFWHALAQIPVVTVRANGRVDVQFDAGERVTAAKQIKVRGKLVGFWASKMPGLTFAIGIEEKERFPPYLEVVLDLDHVNPDGSRTVCSETWTGGGDKF